MYEMLSGRGPFDATTASEMMAAHIAKPPAPLSTLRGSLPASLEQLVMQCLEKNPSARPRSAADVLQALDAMSGEISGARTPSGTPSGMAGARTSGSTGARGGVAHVAPTRSRRGIAIALVAVAALAAAIGGVTYRNAQHEASARLGRDLADSSRLAVLFMPTAHDPADSVLARNLSSAMLNALQSDHRILPLGEERAQSMAVEIGVEPATVSKDTLVAMARDLGTHSTLSASVARVGGGFLLAAEARAVINDSALFRAEVTAKDVSGVPEAIKALAEQSRAGLAAAFGQVPRPKASGKMLGTTPEAARLWTEGLERVDAGDYLTAADKLRNAVALDSTFASGWILLGSSLQNAGVRPHEQFVATRQAYRLRDRIRSKWLKSLVMSPYLRTVGSFGDAVRVLEDGALQDRGQFQGLTENEIALSYSGLRRQDLAIRYYAGGRDTTYRAPNVVDRNYALSLLELGRADEARRELQRYESKAGSSNAIVRRMHHELTFALRDADSTRTIASARLGAAQSAAGRLAASLALRNALVTAGQLDSARAIEQLRRGILRGTNDTASLLLSEVNEALIQAEFMGDAGAAARLDPVLRDGRLNALLPLDRPYAGLVTALAASGRTADAKRVLTEWSASIPPEVARVQGWRIATARGEVLLAEKNGAGALAAFRAGDSINCVPCAWPNYARAYDLMGKRDSAIVWYEKYLSSSSVLLSNAAHARLLARAYRRLGELYEDAGRPKDALQRYSDFVALWKNADGSLQPAVKSAKERMVRLQEKRN
jgi:tetratricopeptide (TPR) repeat protein